MLTKQNIYTRYYHACGFSKNFILPLLLKCSAEIILITFIFVMIDAPFYYYYYFFYSNLFVIFIYLNNIIFTTHNIITKLKIYGITERNTAYKLVDNYILSIKIKLN